MQKRPPIVVILGSVDHGKTTLLDYIRKTSIADREAGGITQAVGAYEIEHPSTGSGQAEKITFVDTPGHEAFGTMRKRGCNCADIGILMVAADDGVKPQTKESIKILKESKTPFVVAINKVDTKGANVEKVKNELMAEEVLLEGYGGNISFQEISAKNGTGVDELLDLVLLAAEVEELKFDPKGALDGFVLESHLDKRQGVIATAIIQNGTLSVGDEIHAGYASGKVKALMNFLGDRIDSATASAPVQILGFNDLPSAGDQIGSEKNGAAQTPDAPQQSGISDEDREGAMYVILRADVSGSLEVLSHVVQEIAQKHRASDDDYPPIHIIDESVGEISDGDVKLAVPKSALIVGFNVKISKAAENLAREQDVTITTSKVIYDLTQTLEETLEKQKVRAVTGRLHILRNFGAKDGKQIIGGKVTEGAISNQSTMSIERREKIIGEGKVVNLQQGKNDVQAVEAGKECGLLFESDKPIKADDVLLAH